MTEFPEINGKPAVKINVHMAEKIGLPNYSNIEVGASITRFVEDTGVDEDIESIREIARGSLEAFMAEERELVLGNLQVTVKS